MKNFNPFSMKAFPYLHFTLFFTGALFFTPQLKAGLFDFTKQLDSIQLIYNTDELRLPGDDFHIGVIAYFKNGKVKKSWNLEKGLMPWFRFTVEVKGGTHFNGKIRVNESLIPSAGKYIQVAVWPNKSKQLAKELLLPLNYEKSVEIVPVSRLVKAPGFGFNFKLVSTFDNGVVKEYTYKSYHDLSDKFVLAVNGGYFRRDMFYIENDIRNIRDHTVNLTAWSKRNPECFYSFDIVLDYKADYYLTLSGSSGAIGFGGSNGSSGTTGSDGCDGGNGGNGADGGNGPDIGVWADLYYDEILKTNLLYIYAENLWTNQEYRYLVNPEGGSFHVISRGGSGGDGGHGGDGGSGGNGSDGATYTKEEKVNDSTTVTVTYRYPGGNGGRGGNGGHGGNGGYGGDGGNLFLYFTDDAIDFQNLIHAGSGGGSPGNGAFGGNGGSGGSGGSGNPSGSSGLSGSGGWSGSMGWSGSDGDIYYDHTDEFVE